MSSAWPLPAGVGRRIRRNLADNGWRVTAAKAVQSLVAPIYLHRAYRLYRIDLARWSPSPRAEESSFSFRLLAPADERQIAEVEESAEWLRGEVAAKLARGDLCLAALSDGRVAGFNLITFGTVLIPLVELARTFRRDAAWSEHIAVHPDFRRQGLASALRRRIFAELKGRGIVRLYGGALPSNTASLELARRVGFTVYADIEYRRILGRKGWRCRRVPRDG